MDQYNGSVNQLSTARSNIHGPAFMANDEYTKSLVMKLFKLKSIIKSEKASELKKKLAKKKYDKILKNILKVKNDNNI
jgi:hypothetical protein